MIYLELFISYLKIGFFGFGGGYSMLSLIHHEVVISHEWISNATLSDIIAISQMTPGPIAINSATYIGYTIAGFWGSVVATTAVCLPSLTIMVLITKFFLKLKNSNYMECVMTAMRPAVIGMIAAASLLLIFPEGNEGASMIDTWSWVLFGAAFVASLKHMSPIKLIVLSAVAGIAIYYIPEAVAGNTPQEKQAKVVEAKNIWRGFDISSSEVITTEKFEQTWVDYLYALQSKAPKAAAEQLKVTLDRTSDNPEAIDALFALSERYLYDPNSPIRNDELFIPLLEFMVDSPAVDQINKIRPEALLKIVKLNRLGHTANDFKVNASESLHQVESPYTLLYFFDNDCNDCKRVSKLLNDSHTLKELIDNKSMRLIKVDALHNAQVDSLYDLKAIPTLYLLDSKKRVLLKDAPIEQILESLNLITNIEHNK